MIPSWHQAPVPVELLIFDEFQHFLRDQAKSNTRGVVNHIKLMMDQHKLAVVMAGTPAGYRSIAQHDELYQRFWRTGDDY